MKPLVRATRNSAVWTCAWTVEVGTKRVADRLTWPAAIELALRLAA